MSKRRIAINDEIAQLIQRKEAAGEAFSVMDIERIQQYTGSGGLQGKGVKKRGVLYEYYTPVPIVEKMIGLAHKYGFSGGSVLEPSCGTGRFLRYLDPSNCACDAYEFSKDDNTGFLVAKYSFPWAHITNDYFESIFYRGNKRVGCDKRYDLVIGNPPYGAFSGFYAGREKRFTKAENYEQYFLEKGIELLRPGGLLVFIIPSSFLDNAQKAEAFKKELHLWSDLLDAYRLPAGVFDHTQIQTDIVVFRKHEQTA